VPEFVPALVRFLANVHTARLMPPTVPEVGVSAIHVGSAGALTLDDAARAAIRASAAVVQRAARGDTPVYGVNTGFGKLASTRISEADLDTLQLNLIRSHSVGVGEPLAAPVVRLMLALKAASLARGASGVREEVVDALLAFRRTTGEFGTLLYCGVDWVDATLARRSMELMAEKVMPAINRAIGG